MIITIQQADYDICNKFSHDVVLTNRDCYAKRNQTDIDKIIDDIRVGKIAEVAVRKLIIARGLYTSEVDFKIYEKSKKSFDADIIGFGNPDKPETRWDFHVKCMKESAARSFGLSWSFQVQDRLVNNPGDREYLALCLHVDNYTIDVKTILRADSVAGMWKDPKLLRLRGIKKVLYWSDIESMELSKSICAQK